MIDDGIFGYIIGKKKHMMYVEDNANLFWQVLIREIFVLMKHYGSQDKMKEAFNKIKIAKHKPKKKDIDRCIIFADFETYNNNKHKEDWSTLLHFCKSSFINILVSGYILNDYSDKNPRFVFLLDLNKGTVRYYETGWKNQLIQELNSATLEEIMSFEDMPVMNYLEMVKEMRENFDAYYISYLKIVEEIEKLHKLKRQSREQGAVNIEEKVAKLIQDMEWKKKELNMSRRVFYNRLCQLDLIEYDANDL